MNYQELYEEVVNDPLGRGYDTMTDAEIAADLNTAYQQRNIESLTGDEIFQATVPTEFSALTDHRQVLWLSFCGRAGIDPFAVSNVDFVNWVFGSGSATVTALADLRIEDISRAEELGLGTITEHDIQVAKETV